MNQDISRHFQDFAARTDALANQMSLNVSELGPKIGISKAMLFAYRSGASPISPKAWRKVRAAEQQVAVPISCDSPAAAESPRPYGSYAEAAIWYEELYLASERAKELAARKDDPKLGSLIFTELVEAWRRGTKHPPPDDDAPLAG